MCWEDFPQLVEQQEEDFLVWMASKKKTDPLIFFRWDEMAIQLMVFSHHPAAIEWSTWVCGEFLPAINWHGYYDPATNHEPPPRRLLDALERREQGRDLMNHIVPGLGDFFADNQKGGDNHR